MSEPLSKHVRVSRRFQLQNPVQFRARTLPMAVRPNGKPRLMEGHVQNISSGGLCVLTRLNLKVSELLVGRITLPGTRAGIPTLLQVRWLLKNSDGARYRAGLQFVLQESMLAALSAPTQALGLEGTGERVSGISPKRISPSGELTPGVE